DTSKAQEVPLEAGSALMFHSLVAHGSGPNNSPHARRTALYAYFPPSVRYTPSKTQEGERTFPVIAGMNGQEEATLVAETAA
ncbi:MAG: phytanoyl-CoA dioxygenase family protein, partial [bacterium]|nr:phytanoyl-CoA dioxygenase family protein [bacterium]